MKPGESSQRTVRTIHLDDEQIATLLDGMDTNATSQATEKRVNRHRYRQKALVVHMQQPGSTITVPYLVPTRNISEGGLSFLHGGFVHPGTRCLAQLITTYGTWDDVPGVVVSCRYVDANIHEVSLHFDRAIDPSIYCREAVSTRVLLAEDDAATARLATLHLKQLNAEVEHVENGKIAVEKALKGMYDLVLMDIDMPVMDGVEAVKTLREKGYTGTIIAVTAMTRPEDRQRCLDAGCDKYIPKPFKRKDLDDLLQALREEPLISSHQDDPQMVDVISAYVQELPGKVRAVEEAMARKDAKALESVVRMLKGEGSAYGFEIITETAARIETAILEGADLGSVAADTKELVKLCMHARSSARAATSSGGT